uniref:Uncharacterized protein n=1 Tax=Anguilla anguilla TaxID=7936 RepID=A0A0E9SPV8_ANGAN
MARVSAQALCETETASVHLLDLPLASSFTITINVKPPTTGQKNQHI